MGNYTKFPPNGIYQHDPYRLFPGGSDNNGGDDDDDS